MKTLVLGSYVNANCLKVQKLPQTGESLLANDSWSEHGGKGLNVGVALHRLMGKVELLLPIGQDQSGDAVISLLENETLNTRHVVRTWDRSGFGVGFVANNGENFLAVYPGANAHLDETHVNKALELIDEPGMLYAQLEIPQTTVVAAFKKAHTRKIMTILNPSPIQNLHPDFIKLSDILILNENEALHLFGCTNTESGRNLSEWLENLPKWAKTLHWQNSLLIVTLAERGCVALKQNSIHHQSAWPISEQDATGAGDAFNAGVLYGLNHKLPIADLLSFACACGALVASESGVLQNLPDLETVESFMLTRDRPVLTSIDLAAS
jgi:ribokinase